MIDKEKISNYLWLSPLYFLSVGVLYLWGYWPNFGINIFEYVALADVVKVAIIPVGSVFIFILIGFGFGEALVSDRFTEGGGRHTKTGRFLNKIRGFLLFLYVLGLFIVVFFPVNNKWYILPILLLWPLYFPLKKAGFLEEISNDSARSLLIAAIVTLPLYSFAQGKINAEYILKNQKYKYIIWQDNNIEERLKFIGHANEYVFFISDNNETLFISKADKMSPLRLYDFDKEEKKLKDKET